MTILSALIGLAGLYLIGYLNHCADVKRWEHRQEMEAFHAAENRIKELHSKGRVFFNGDILH